MDPLSVAALIAGLLSATVSISKILSPYVAAAREVTTIAVHVHAEVQAASIILGALQSLTQNLASIPTQRTALVQLDQLITIFTNGVLILSDLETLIELLSLPGSRLTLRSRLQWARKETAFVSLLSRLQCFKSSISLVLGILQK